MKQKDIAIIVTSMLGVLMTVFLIFYSLSFLGTAISGSLNLQETTGGSTIQFNLAGYKALNLENQ